MHGKSNMKKAFCEPGNVAFCPPIALASVLAFDLAGESFTLKRSEANGGDITFTNYDELSKSFADGSLHPGDLKTGASALIFELLEKLAKAMKEGDVTKAAKGLKALNKKKK